MHARFGKIQSAISVIMENRLLESAAGAAKLLSYNQDYGSFTGQGAKSHPGLSVRSADGERRKKPQPRTASRYSADWLCHLLAGRKAPRRRAAHGRSEKLHSQLTMLLIDEPFCNQRRVKWIRSGPATSGRNSIGIFASRDYFVACNRRYRRPCDMDACRMARVIR
jgi:hypothetical protein